LSEQLERRIIIGLIVSTDFTQRIRKRWNERYLKSSMAKLLSTWCLEYFDKYEKAPYGDIEGIYIEKLKNGHIPKDVAEEIEEDILPGLDEEYEEGQQFNSDYLFDQTKKYFQERHLEIHSEEIKDLVDAGQLEEAENLATSYQLLVSDISIGLDLSKEEALVEVESAFNQSVQRVISYPGALGELWNDQMIRGGFVGLMAPEKRGKTYWLLELAMRGVTQKANVAFFQAGDMTQSQQLRRICIYLARKSDNPKYCGELYLPIRDCLLNQLNRCDSEEREDSLGPFAGMKVEDNDNLREIRKKIDWKKLYKAYQTFEDYRPCYNCPQWRMNGAIWLKKIDTGPPLQAPEAKKVLTKFFKKYKRHFLLSTHVSGTLSIKEIRSILSTWEKERGFVPDLILVDYADLLISDTKEFRHSQDSIWRGLRGLSQERHCLVVTVTQTDSASYEQDRLRLKNFSEDKRKYSHVTAMYGLNQDPKGREKELGLMIINELVVREGEFSSAREVYVMQKLQIGRPYLGSFR
jgi:hypothetical protein